MILQIAMIRKSTFYFIVIIIIIIITSVAILAQAIFVRYCVCYRTSVHERDVGGHLQSDSVDVPAKPDRLLVTMSVTRNAPGSASAHARQRLARSAAVRGSRDARVRHGTSAKSFLTDVEPVVAIGRPGRKFIDVARSNRSQFVRVSTLSRTPWLRALVPQYMGK